MSTSTISPARQDASRNRSSMGAVSAKTSVTAAHAVRAYGSGAVSKDRIAWVDVAKGMSILLVVLLHAHVYLNPIALSVDVYTFVNSAFRPVRMPLFFALSGVLAASLIQKNWATVMEKRLWQLIYIFSLWSLVHIVLYKYFLWHPFATFNASMPLEWIYNLLHPARTGIWFIWALAFYLVFARSLRRVPYLAVALSLGAGVLGETNLPTEWGWTMPPEAVLRYLPFFVIPALIGRSFLTGSSRHPLALFLGGMMVVLATKLLPDFWPGRLDDGALLVIRSAGGLGVGIGAAIFLSRIEITRSFLSYFGRRSLPIYLMHNLVLAVLAMTLVGTEIPGLPLVAVPLCTVLAVLVSLFLDHLLKLIGARVVFEPFPLSRRAQLS